MNPADRAILHAGRCQSKRSAHADVGIPPHLSERAGGHAADAFRDPSGQRGRNPKMANEAHGPLASLVRGVAAGAAGTAAMTAAQTAYYKATGGEPSSMPAEVAKRIIGGVGQRAGAQGGRGRAHTHMPR